MNAWSVSMGLPYAILIGALASCATEDAGMKSSGAGTATSAPARATSGSAPSGSTAVPKSLNALSDTLSACLARIPKDSPSGARMLAEDSCKRDEAVRQGIVGTASTKSGDRVSAGAEGDTMQACMARIPKDATAGQRMLAEESCKRDEANRK
jgi:hypothetical protein